MPADSFSSFLGMTLQATGNNANAWGTILNGSALQTLEKAIAGNVGHAVTGGTLDLSGSPPPAAQTQMLEMLQTFTGVLAANQLVKVPNVSKLWAIANNTTGAFQLQFQIGAGTIINVPQGTTKFVVCDGAGNLIRMDKDQVGNFEHNSVVKPGTLECTGASLLRTDYPDLFTAIGVTYGAVDGTHFTLPLLTDTGRFLRSRDGTLTLGTYQANQNLAHTHAGASFSGTTGLISQDHTHTFSGTTGTESANHTHVYNAPTNVPGETGGGSFAADTGTGTPTNSGVEGTAHTHSYSGSTTGVSANHTHTFSGTTGTIPSSGGTEARPEALAVIISIRY